MAGNGATAVWAVTPRGARLARRIARELPDAQVYLKADGGDDKQSTSFDRLSDAVARVFDRYEAHIFVMAAGIAVRMIAPHIRSKIADPAVLAADEAGRFVISLLSGHTGGANKLAVSVAGHIGATPVITTATDNAGVPAVDVLAEQYEIAIENHGAVRPVSKAFLAGGRVWRHDPYHVLDPALNKWTDRPGPADFERGPGIFIDHRVTEPAGDVLVLRPKTLAAGVGCNSGTSETELIEAVSRVFAAFRLSLSSIRGFATISDKLAEPGLQAMARHFDRKLEGFGRNRLASVADVPNPSETVTKYMGVNSVCEAAAILEAGRGRLVVPKQKRGNVTVAVAVVSCMS